MGTLKKKMFEIKTLHKTTKLSPDAKAFADDQLKVTSTVEFVFDIWENPVGKEEKCWLPAFFFFSHEVF